MKKGICVAAAAALTVAAAISAPAQPQKKAPQRPKGNIVVKLSVEDGRSFNEGTVVMKGRKVKLKKDQN